MGVLRCVRTRVSQRISAVRSIVMTWQGKHLQANLGILPVSDAAALLRATIAAPRSPSFLLLPCDGLAKPQRAAARLKGSQPGGLARTKSDYKSSAYVAAHAAAMQRLKQSKGKIGTLLTTVLATALAPANALSHLELGVHLLPQQLRALSGALSGAAALRSLSLAGSRLGDVGLTGLQPGLLACVRLQVLDLAGCALTDAGASTVASVLRQRAAECAPVRTCAPVVAGPP